MSPKMRNKHAFSPGVLYSGHVWNDVQELIFEFENP